MIAFRDLRAGGVASTMWRHRQAALEPAGGREKRSSGRPCRLLRSRRAALVMRPASRRTTLLAEKPARPSDVSPSYESKYWHVLSWEKGASIWPDSALGPEPGLP